MKKFFQIAGFPFRLVVITTGLFFQGLFSLIVPPCWEDDTLQEAWKFILKGE